MPKFGCKTGVSLGVLGVISWLKSTHPFIFLLLLLGVVWIMDYIFWKNFVIIKQGKTWSLPIMPCHMACKSKWSWPILIWHCLEGNIRCICQNTMKLNRLILTCCPLHYEAMWLGLRWHPHKISWYRVGNTASQRPKTLWVSYSWRNAIRTVLENCTEQEKVFSKGIW